MKVHLPQADSVRCGVTRFDGGHAADVAHVRYRRQSANGRLHRAADVRGIHGVGDIQRPEVTGDILADSRVVQVLVVG